MFQWEWLTVLTPGPSWIRFDLMALVFTSSLRSHSQSALGDCVWRIWYPVVAESIIVFAETIEVKWMHTALSVLPLMPLWERWSISGCALLYLLVSICTFKSSQRCFTYLLDFSQMLTRPGALTPPLWMNKGKQNSHSFSTRKTPKTKLGSFFSRGKKKNSLHPNVPAEKFCSRIEHINQDLTTENTLMLKMEENSGKSSRLNAAFACSYVCMPESLFT